MIKKLIYWVIPFLIIMTIFSSCHHRKKDTRNQISNKIMGRDINEIVEKRGYPDDSIIAPNGNKVYMYIKENIEIEKKRSSRQVYKWDMNEMGMKWKDKDPEIIYNKYKCIMYLEVNDDNKIVNVKFKGNACPK